MSVTLFQVPIGVFSLSNKKVQNTEFRDALIRVFQDLIMFSNLDQCENKNSCVCVDT